ncbi:MAG: hypothetical protein V1709_09700 [Planctomycetota bacterium]
MKTDNLPKALIKTLADDTQREKLSAICERLKECGKAPGLKGNPDTTYLDLVFYGIQSHIPFSKINSLLNKE